MNTCKGCGQECRVIGVDHGIGSYEYWGATGYDSRVELASDCCEADFEGEAPEPDFDEPDYYDYEENYA